MRETELWSRLQQHLGKAYCRVWAAEYSLARLQGQTIDQALEHGVPCKEIWRAAWEALALPERER